MSMILDALSRAEKERQSEETVGLDTARYVTSSTIKEDRFKKWVLLALLANFLLIIFVSVGYVWKNHFQESAVEVVEAPALEDAPATTQYNVSPEEIMPVTEVVVPEVVSTGKNFPEAIALVGEENRTSTLSEEALVIKNRIKKNISKKPSSKIAKKTPPVKYSSQPLSPPRNHISNQAVENLSNLNNVSTTGYNKLSELPTSERSSLSQYEMNVHVYDDNPQSRFVLINMVKYKEGDQLQGGQAIVSSIVPEGVVVDYGSGKALLERNQ